jgi:C-terminal processing protease CtpA/Prc
VAYLKLSSVKVADAAAYIRDAAGTKGLIIDIRNYPSEFVVEALGSLLYSEKKAFATNTANYLALPGATRWLQPKEIEPAEPRYKGRIAILIDEKTMSQAEYTAMAFRAAPGAIVIGSTTSGADGTVAPVPLPGNLQSRISGLAVFYPDRTPTQRIGIKPDIWVTPTIAGIRAGRDELVETAIAEIMKPH